MTNMTQVLATMIKRARIVDDDEEDDKKGGRPRAKDISSRGAGGFLGDLFGSGSASYRAGAARAMARAAGTDDALPVDVNYPRTAGIARVLLYALLTGAGGVAAGGALGGLDPTLGRLGGAAIGGVAGAAGGGLGGALHSLIRRRGGISQARKDYDRARRDGTLTDHDTPAVGYGGAWPLLTPYSGNWRLGELDARRAIAGRGRTRYRPGRAISDFAPAGFAAGPYVPPLAGLLGGYTSHVQAGSLEDDDRDD